MILLEKLYTQSPNYKYNYFVGKINFQGKHYITIVIEINH